MDFIDYTSKAKMLRSDFQNSLLGVAISILGSFYSFHALGALRDCSKAVSVKISGNVVMKFCDIPAGSAVIGSSDRLTTAYPAFARNFKNFQIGQYTVTQEQYLAVMGAGRIPWRDGSGTKRNVKIGNDYPASYVSLEMARDFARGMNNIDNTAQYRLPTEAEYEYAARAGTKTQYFWGDNFDPSYVYYSENTKSAQHPQNVKTCPDRARDAKEPGYCANKFGLMHMTGNLYHWTEDKYVNSYKDAPVDGNVPYGKTGDSGMSYNDNVIRGGSWDMESRYTLSSFRNSAMGSGHFDSIGFRLVRIPKK